MPRVTQAVIDHLEAIQVDEQYRQRGLLTNRLLHGQLEAGVEQQAIGQVSQGIVMCQVMQSVLGFL